MRKQIINAYVLQGEIGQTGLPGLPGADGLIVSRHSTQNVIVTTCLTAKLYATISLFAT